MTFSTERREKVFDIPERDVLRYFVWGIGADLPHSVAVPVFPGIPDGAVFVAVRHEPYLRVFRCLISHPSFDPVPPGSFPPPLGGGLGFAEYRRVELKWPDPDSSAAHRHLTTDTPAVLGKS